MLPAVTLKRLVLLSFILIAAPLAATSPFVRPSPGEAANGIPLPARTFNPPAGHVHAPYLALTWSAGETHAGVPITLTMTAYDGQGQRDQTRNGTAILHLRDLRAQVTPASGGSPIAGQPTGNELRVLVPLAGGSAGVSVLFRTPGSQPAVAELVDSPTVAGDAGTLQVRATFLRIQGSGQPSRGQPAHYTIHAMDDQNQPVPGYVDATEILSTDRGVLVTDPSGHDRPATGRAIHVARPEEQGSTALDLTCSQPGAHSVSVRELDGVSPPAKLDVVVGGGGRRGGAPAVIAPAVPVPLPVGPHNRAVQDPLADLAPQRPSAEVGPADDALAEPAPPEDAVSAPSDTGQAGPMTISGTTSDTYSGTRTLNASVGTTLCTSVTLTSSSTFSVSLPPACGIGAVSFSVYGYQAALVTSSGATCLPYTPGLTVTGITVYPYGIPSANCPGGSAGPMTVAGAVSGPSSGTRALAVTSGGVLCATTSLANASSFSLVLPGVCAAGALTFAVAGAGAGLVTAGGATCLLLQPGTVVSGLTLTPGGNQDVSCAPAAGQPTVAGVGPDLGTPNGNTQVVITGAGFSPTTGATVISFGPYLAGGIYCSSSTNCTAVSPPGNGIVDVTANVAGRVSPSTAADRFTYGTVPSPPPAGTMSLYGWTSDYYPGIRVVAASVGGTQCATFTQVFNSYFNLTLPGGCGTAGQAVTFAAAGAPAGLRTSASATCLPFAPGANVFGLTMVTGGTPDTSCGPGAGGPPMGISGTTTDFPSKARLITFSVGGYLCGYLTQSGTSSFSASMPGNCGSGAVTIGVGSAPAGLTTANGGTCLAFVAGGLATGITVNPNGTPDATCGGHPPNSGMTVTGWTSVFTFGQALAASVNGTPCGTTAQYMTYFAIGLPGTCGTGAVTFTVAGVPNGLTTPGGASCLTFVPGTTVYGVTLSTTQPQSIGCGSAAGTPSMQVSGYTTDYPPAGRVLNASVGGTLCVSYQQWIGSYFSLAVPGTCGGGAVTFSTGGTAAGLTTAAGATCLAFAPGGTVYGKNVSPGGTPDSSCAGSPGGASPTNSTLVAQPASVVADGTHTTTLIATVVDANGNFLPGKTVIIRAGGGASQVSPTSAITNFAGVAAFSVKDTAVESVSYTAADTSDSVPIQQTATVTYTANVPMTLSGNTTDTPAGSRTLSVSVGGTLCATTSQSSSSGFSLQLPAACGPGAVTFAVAGAAAGLSTADGATCLAFAAGQTVAGLSVNPAGTPNPSCVAGGLPPSVASVTPSAGAAGGGTTVTITGAGFSTANSATAFNFGPNRASSVSCSSSASCTAISPAGTGVVDVQAIVAGLASRTSAADQFSYQGTNSSAGSLALTLSAGATNAGVPLTLTVRALDGSGATNAAYRGTVALTSTDAAFSPGSAATYTFTTADAGTHSFSVSFNTAGPAQTMTAQDTGATPLGGTSPAVSVGETFLSASLPASGVQQGLATTLAVQARNAAGAVVSGYQGTVLLASSYDSVASTNWGAGVSQAAYTFTAADAGTHSFAPIFSYAGNQSATGADLALETRSVTSAPTAVANAPAAAYAHTSAPAGTKLANGTTVWAYVGEQGQLYVRRNAGTVAAPSWEPLVTVRTLNSNGLGADSPALVQLGSQLALFHTYTDGTYYQVWLTTSADGGKTWSAPVQITHESGNVQRVQAVSNGTNVWLFWSRQDTNGQVLYQSTSDLSNWTARTAVGQPIGAPVGNTTANFAVTRLASGSWLLGWLAPSSIGELPYAAAGDYAYPTVHTATSADLATFANGNELNKPYSQRGSASIALAQDPASGTIYGLYEGFTPPFDTYVVERTSSDGSGATWTGTATIIASDSSQPANGGQGYTGTLPAIIANGLACANSVQVQGGAAQSYDTGTWASTASGTGVNVQSCVASTAGNSLPIPYGDDPRTFDMTDVTGYLPTGGTDLILPALGYPLTVQRTYNSFDAINGAGSAFGMGWSWSLGATLTALADGSVSIDDGSGRRLNFWWNGSGWTPGPAIDGSLVSISGGGYQFTDQQQRVWSFTAAGRLSAISDTNGNTVTLTYSGGNLASVAAAGGRTLTVTSDGNGHITQIAGSAGLSASYTYDGSGNLLTATDATGAKTTYSYDARHELLTVVDANGHAAITYAYGSLGRVVQTTDAAGKVTTRAADLQGYTGNLNQGNAITDPLGNVASVQFDASQRPTQLDVSQGQALSQRSLWSYDANDDITGATNADDVSNGYSYNGQGDLLTATLNTGQGGQNAQYGFSYNSLNEPLAATDPLGHTYTHTYDSHGNLTALTDPLGHTYTHTYDSHGNLTALTDPLGHGSTFTYTSAGLVATAADANGNVTSYTYDAAGDMLTVTQPGGIIWHLSYDAAGRQVSVTDPNGHTTQQTVDGLGRVLTSTNALNQVSSAVYDAVGNQLRATDVYGNVTTYAYDARNLLTQMTDALGEVTTRAYDANGNLVTETNPLGKIWQLSYDGLNRLTSAQDPLGNSVSYAYDPLGNRSAVTDADGHTTQYTYSGLNQLTAMTDALGNVTSFSYDTAGRRTSTTDPLGHTASETYDNANHVIGSVDALSHTSGYQYDPAGNLTKLTDALGHGTTYGYNGLNRQVSVTDALGYAVEYAYDGPGNPTAMTHQLGKTAHAGYDPLNRLASRTDPLGNVTSIAYGLATPRQTTTDPLGHSTIDDYDALGRTARVTDAAGGVTQYAYDAAGNLHQITNALGRVWTYSFDPANRLAGGADPLGHAAGYSYDPAGNLTQVHKADGVTNRFTFDALNRLNGIDPGNTGTPSISFAYDAAGRRTGMADPTGSTGWSYDAAGQLSSVTRPVTGTVAYPYDAGGNVSRLTYPSGQQVSYSYDPRNALTGVTDWLGHGATSYSYDAAGRQVSAGFPNGVAETLNYDDDGRPTNVAYSKAGATLLGLRSLFQIS